MRFCFLGFTSFNDPQCQTSETLRRLPLLPQTTVPVHAPRKIVGHRGSALGETAAVTSPTMLQAVEEQDSTGVAKDARSALH